MTKKELEYIESVVCQVQSPDADEVEPITRLYYQMRRWLYEQRHKLGRPLKCEIDGSIY